MARSNTATLDGVTVGYGTRDSHNVEDAQVHTMGRISQAEIRIDHSTHAALATSTAATSKSFQLPAGSALVNAKLIVSEAFADLTSIIVGTKIADGTTVDNNGLIDTTLLAALTAGATVEGAGAQLGGDVLAADSYVSLDVTGTAPTAGECVLVIEYYQPVPSSNSPAPVQGIVGTL